LTESLVRLEKNGVISTLTLDNPPVNAASTRLMNALHGRLDEIEKDKEARCVILTGAGERGLQSVSRAGKKDAKSSRNVSDPDRCGNSWLLHWRRYRTRLGLRYPASCR
jgi:hypothetical protein